MEISVMKCSISVLSKKSSPHPRVVAPPAPLSARAKTVIVAVLGWMLAWRPKLALMMGKLIWWFLPWLREA
jgi:hypothetical protein